MRSATPNALPEPPAKRAWERPQLRTLVVGDTFDPASGLTLAQWNAARELINRPR